MLTECTEPRCPCHLIASAPAWVPAPPLDCQPDAGCDCHRRRALDALAGAR